MKDRERMKTGEAGKAADPKRATRRPRVSQHKELAVVTLGMVAAIAGFGGMLGAAPPQTTQTSAPRPALVSSATPGPTSSAQPAHQRTPAFSAASPVQHAQAPVVQTQGS